MRSRLRHTLGLQFGGIQLILAEPVNIDDVNAQLNEAWDLDEDQFAEPASTAQEAENAKAFDISDDDLRDLIRPAFHVASAVLRH